MISCHSPTNASDDTICCYNELSSLVHTILKHNIGEDTNAQIG